MTKRTIQFNDKKDNTIQWQKGHYNSMTKRTIQCNDQKKRRKDKLTQKIKDRVTRTHYIRVWIQVLLWSIFWSRHNFEALFGGVHVAHLFSFLFHVVIRFVSCTKYCLCLWIFHSELSIVFSNFNLKRWGKQVNKLEILNKDINK